MQRLQLSSFMLLPSSTKRNHDFPIDSRVDLRCLDFDGTFPKTT